MTLAGSEQDAMDAGRLLRLLGPLDERAARLEATEIARGSRAWSDGRRRIGQHVWEMAVMKAISAGDHLRAWRQVVVARELPIFAQYSLLRTALETSTVLRWLVDPKADQATRIARGVTVQAYDFDERRKWEDAGARSAAAAGDPPPKPPPSGKSASERLATLRADAKRARIPIGGINSVEICGEFGPADDKGHRSGEVLYRLFSAMAHGTLWAVLPLGDIGDVRPGLHAGTFSARVTASSRYTLGATAEVMALYTTALDELEAYARP